MQILWRGNANAWECDELGHLNVRFYMAKAQEAVASFAESLGMRRAFAANATATLRLKQTRLRFLSEARPGAPLLIKGGVLAHDCNSVTLALILEQSGRQAPAASFEVELEHIAPQTGRVFNWPSRILASLDQAHIPRPDSLQTRSLSHDPGTSDMSLERAQAMGLQEIGRGRINPEDLDAFNRMRVEFTIGKISNSVNHFSDGFPEQWMAFSQNQPLTLSSAVLEARIILRRLPASGDGYVIRSGLKSASQNIRTLVHWAFDPVSGQALWSMEAVACMLDLKTRKLAPVSDHMLAKLKAKTNADLKA